MAHIYAVGESLLDIIFKEGQVQTARPGGSAFNTSISLGRLGLPVSFISETGRDRVGAMIRDFMEQNRVDCSRLSWFRTGQTALALAFLDRNNDASYQFYKEYPEQRLEVDFPDFQPGDLLMYGSFYALDPGIRLRVKELLVKAEAEGATLVYDPNFRNAHASGRDRLLEVIRENMSFAHLVRASDEDLHNIFGVSGGEEAWAEVSKYCGILVRTSGSGQVSFSSSSLAFSLQTEAIEPVSTIGAGDTFNAGILYGLFRRKCTRDDLSRLKKDDWLEILKTASAFAREVCLSYDNYIPKEVAARY